MQLIRSILLRLLLFSCTLVLPHGLSATTFTFNAVLGGAWTDATKWTPGYPGTTIGAAHEVVITGAFGICYVNANVTIEGTLTTNFALQVNSGKTLTIDGGTFTNNSNVDIDGDLNILSGGTYNNDGNTDVNSGGVLTSGGTFTSSGTLGLNSGGLFQLDNTFTITSSTLSNDGTININSNGDLKVNNSSSLTNSGTINLDGDLRINSFSTLTNTGTLDLNSGGLLFLNSANATWPNFNWNGGTTKISSNSDIDMTGFKIIPNGGTLEIVGILNIDGTLVKYGTLTNIGELNIDGILIIYGTLTNSGELNLNSGGELKMNSISTSLPNGTFNWNSGGTVTVGIYGEMTLSSALTIEPGRTLRVDGTLILNAALTNNGVLDLKSGGELILNTDPATMPDGTFYWRNGGTVTVGSSGNLILTSSLTIQSGRTLKVEGEVNINSGGILTVKGTLDNGNGTLNLNTGGELILDKSPASIPDGTFNWNTGSTLAIGSNGHLTVSSSMTVPSATTLKVDGTLQIINNIALTNNGTLTINGIVNNYKFIRNYSGAILNNYATLNNYSSGTINNSQSTINNYSTLNNEGEIINRDNSDFNIENNGTLTNNGTFDNYSGADVAINSGGTFTNNGTIENTSTINLNAGGELFLNTNLASLFTGFFNWLAGGDVTIGSSGEWTISSPLAIEPGSTLQVDGVLINESTLTINGVVENNGTFTTAGYSINGTGSVNGNLLNKGTLSPGASPGCFTVNGGFEANGSSILEIELADGSPCIDFDQIIVNGDAAIRGNINITFPSGTPTTTTFAILTATGTKTDNSPTINWPAGFTGSGSFVGNEYQVSFSVLPVELVFFRAEKKDKNSVELKWQTASEQNNRGFDIQRSNDGAEWENIGFVEGAGTTTEKQYYSFTDHPSASGIFYYRLRQMDFGGGSDFSPVRSVKLENRNSEIKIFPNPATSFINIHLENEWEGELTLLLVNSIGQIVHAEKRMKPDESADWKIDLSNFSNGIYQVVISDGKITMVDLAYVQDKN